MGVDLDRATASGRDAPGGAGSRESSRVGAGGMPRRAGISLERVVRFGGEPPPCTDESTV